MLLAALIGIYLGYVLLVQDIAYTRAQTELSFWGRDNYQPSEQVIAETGDRLEGLLDSAPHHPEYQKLQALYNSWQAYWSSGMPERDSLNSETMSNQYGALLSRPAHRQDWSKMIEYASRARNGETMLQLAQDRQVLLSPPEILEGTARQDKR